MDFKQNTPRNKVSLLSERVLDAIDTTHDGLRAVLVRRFGLPEDINFRVTYNIIKVVLMYQYLEKKNKTIEELTRQLEEEKALRREEAERRKREEERRKQEEERRKQLENENRRLKEELNMLKDKKLG